MKSLLKNATVITQNGNREILPQTDVLIDGAHIAAIGRRLEGPVDKTIDVTDLIVSPGIINTHVHLGETAYAPFMPQRTPLDAYLQQAEAYAAAIASIEGARQTIASYSLLQLIQAGTTTVGGGRTAASASQLGIRNVSGYMLMRSQKLGHFSQDITGGFTNEQAIYANGLTSHAFFIHSLHTVDAQILSEVAPLFAADTTIRLMIHVAESELSRKGAEQKWGMSEIEVLESYSLLNNRTLIIHGNHLTNKDLRTIRKYGASIAHCPSSNMNTADDMLSLCTVAEEGITAAIATDGVVTSGSFSALHEAHIAYQYHNRFERNDSVSAQRVFDMVTINAAKALGLEQQIGSIEVGKAADIVIYSPPFPASTIDPVKQLIYYTELATVREVFINGEHRLAQSQLLLPNAKGIEQEFQSILQSIADELSVSK